MVAQPDGWPAPSINREHTRRETQAFYLFLGDPRLPRRPRRPRRYALPLVLRRIEPMRGKTQEGIIAEDAEEQRIAEKRLKTSLRQSISGGRR